MSTQLENLDFAAMDAAEEGSRLYSREEEWLMQRWGKFTASEMHRLMASTGKNGELSKGAVTYTQEKAVEICTDFSPDFFVSFDMQWGIDHELEAVERFEAETLIRCKATGEDQVFLESACGNWGGTPDGIAVLNNTGVEIKCPKSLTHLKYMDITDAQDLKLVNPNYYWQCQALMQLQGVDCWKFVSYDPRYTKPANQIHIVDICPVASDVELMLERIDMAVTLRNRIVEGLS